MATKQIIKQGAKNLDKAADLSRAGVRVLNTEAIDPGGYLTGVRPDIVERYSRYATPDNLGYQSHVVGNATPADLAKELELEVPGMSEGIDEETMFFLEEYKMGKEFGELENVPELTGIVDGKGVFVVDRSAVDIEGLRYALMEDPDQRLPLFMNFGEPVSEAEFALPRYFRFSDEPEDTIRDLWPSRTGNFKYRDADSIRDITSQKMTGYFSNPLIKPEEKPAFVNFMFSDPAATLQASSSWTELVMKLARDDGPRQGLRRAWSETIQNTNLVPKEEGSLEAKSFLLKKVREEVASTSKAFKAPGVSDPRPDLMYTVRNITGEDDDSLALFSRIDGRTFNPEDLGFTADTLPQLLLGREGGMHLGTSSYQVTSFERDVKSGGAMSKDILSLMAITLKELMPSKAMRKKFADKLGESITRNTTTTRSGADLTNKIDSTAIFDDVIDLIPEDAVTEEKFVEFINGVSAAQERARNGIKYSVQVLAKSPIYLVDTGRFYPERIASQIRDIDIFKKYKDQIDWIIENGGGHQTNTDEFVESLDLVHEILEKEGFDHIIYTNNHADEAGGTPSLIVWRQDSISIAAKEAIDSGTYDAKAMYSGILAPLLLGDEDENK